MRIRGGEIGSIQALLDLMETQLAAFDRQRDNRAAFLRVYTRMTRRVQERLREDFFADPAWLEEVAVRFGAYYFAALDAYDAGKPCPPAWQDAFTAAAGNCTFVLQDVLLGINAHINNDLPQVMTDILAAHGDWPHFARLTARRFDHDQVNRILHELIPVVEGEVAQHYGRLLKALGWVLGRLDDMLAVYGLISWRNAVWSKAMFLLAAASPRERDVVRGWVEADARAIGRDILTSSPRWLCWMAPWFRRWRLG